MTDRRAFLTAALIAPVAIAAPAHAAATFACPQTSASVAWNAAMAKYEAAKARADEFHALAKERWDKADAHRPNYLIRHEAKNGQVVYHDLDPGRADHGKYLFDGKGVDLYRSIRPQIEQIHAQHEAYQRACAAVDYDNLVDQADEFCAAMVDAEDVLLALPAPDLGALEWKMLRWREQSEDSSLMPQNFDAMLADVRRLGERGQA